MALADGGLAALVGAIAGGLVAWALRERRLAADHAWGGVAACALAAAGAARAMRAWLEGLRVPVYDEQAYRLHADLVAQGSLIARDVPFAELHRAGFVINESGAFASAFPPGWPLVLGLATRAGLAEWAAPLLAALGVLSTAWLAHLCFRGDARATLVAAALAAAHPWVLAQATTDLSHILTWALSTSAAALALWALRAPSRALAARAAAAAIGGAAAGLALATRPLDGLLLVAPFAAWGAYALATGRRESVAVLLAFGLSAALGALLQLQYNQALTGDPWTFPIHHYVAHLDASPTCHRLGFGDDVGCRSLHGDGWPGFSTADAWSVTWERGRAFWNDAWGHALGWLLCVGAALAAWRDRDGGDARVDPASAAAIAFAALAPVFAYGAFYHHGNAVGPRLWFAAMPLLLVGAAGLSMHGQAARIAIGGLAGLLAASSVFTTTAPSRWFVLDDAQPQFVVREALQQAGVERVAVVVPPEFAYLFRRALRDGPGGGDVIALTDRDAPGASWDLAARDRALFRYDIATDALIPVADSNAPLRIARFGTFAPLWDTSGDPCPIHASEGVEVARCAFDAPGDFAAIAVDPMVGATQARVGLLVERAPEYGVVQVYVNGEPVGDAKDLSLDPGTAAHTGALGVGALDVSERTRVEVRVVRAGRNGGHAAGLVGVRLTPREP